MIEEVVKVFGRIDLAFNNAGIASLPMKLHEQDVDTFDKIVCVSFSNS